ncbi:MAG: histidine kinase, partial [Marinilabiliales bacterium]
GDRIFIFSDGLPEQFGGEKGKKFMFPRFRKMLTEISDIQSHEQFKYTDNRFNEWKQGYEQIDDILLVGIEFDA